MGTYSKYMTRTTKRKQDCDCSKSFAHLHNHLQFADI